MKALGGSLEGGRRTRSSVRESTAPSPKAVEPVKRKAAATPRQRKKAKNDVIDEIDSGNHVEEKQTTESEQVRIGLINIERLTNYISFD